jgi:exopolyphosphatase/pppGpp-phosphohydrolase
VAVNGSLCGEAIERTLAALGVCASKIERHKVGRARHIATEACRRACNVSRRADRLGGVATELLDMTSVPWGVVTLTESCVKGQPREQPDRPEQSVLLVAKVLARSLTSTAIAGTLLSKLIV